MGSPELSQGRVEDYLARLEETYGSVPVNQTTLSLPAERYTSVRDRGPDGRVQAIIEIHNDDREVLHVTDDGQDLPGIRVGFEDDLEPRLRSAVADMTGVECAIDGLERVSIAGVRNADDPDCETIFRMEVLFSGKQVSGTADPDAEWLATAETEQVLVG